MSTSIIAVIARKRLFSSAHFYRQKTFSNEENQRVFGRCFTEHGHGHNYTLEAFIEGPIDARTRLIVNLTDVDQILEASTSPLDHHHLNFDVPEFKELVPTTENIALYLQSRILYELKTRLPHLRLNRLRLFETDDLWVEVIS